MNPGDELCLYRSEGIYRSWPAWKLWRLAAELPIEELHVEQLNILDSSMWFRDASLREIIPHVRRAMTVDMRYPILLAPDGWILEGCHRVLRALIDEQELIQVKRFPKLPD